MTYGTHGPIEVALKKCKRAMLCVFGFSTVINILNMFMPLYSLQVLDRVASTGNMNTLFLLTLITVGALTVMTIIEGSRRFILASMSQWLEGELSRELILKGFILNSGQPSISSAQVIRDLQTIRSFISGNSCIGLFDAPWSLLFFTCVWIINPAVGVVALFGIIALIIFALLSEKATTSILKQVNELSYKNFQALDATSKHSETIEAMGMGGNVADGWLSRQSMASGLSQIAAARSNLIMITLKYVRMLIQVAVYCAGISYALKGGGTIGGVIAASILMGKVLAPFEAFVNTWKTIVSTRVSYARLKAVQKNTSVCKEYSVGLLPTIVGKIDVNNLVVAYPSTRQVILKGVSFSLNPGECLAVIGPSGAGKTTLLKSILGLITPMSGAVSIDDIETTKWGREYLGASTGFVGQECVLFDGSIHDNIARLKKDASPTMVIDAAKIAGAHNMIMALPNSYETTTGPQLLLSAGQKQRLALARSVFGDIKILLLDEPNSHLDHEGEAHLAGVMKWAKDNKITVVFTTHRMGLLQAADKVLILQNGTVMKYGLRDEVLVAVPHPQKKPESQQA